MRILILSFLFIVTIFSAKAQIKSGSFEIDGNLQQINIRANADFGRFRTELSAGYGITEERINYYHAELHMEPADIYFALEMSKVCNRSVDEIVPVYREHRSHGWGEIAKEMGIKPGSDQFHALKSKAMKKSKSTGPKGKGNGHRKEHGNDKGKSHKN